MEQFCQAAQGCASADACSDVVLQALASPDVFAFSELLDVPNVAQVSRCNHG